MKNILVEDDIFSFYVHYLPYIQLQPWKKANIQNVINTVMIYETGSILS